MVYDGKGSLTSLTDPVSNLTSFTHDGAGNMLSETNAQGTRSYVYDGQNRLVSSVDRNERVREFGYDAGGHFTQERWLTNGVVTHTIDYGYDAGGKLVSAGDASSQYLYTYDANGHLDVVTESGSGLGAVYTFDYDANVAGDIVAVTVSVNGSVDHVENYTYDAQRRMTQVLQ